MSKATDSIVKIANAIDKYGSDITIKVVTKDISLYDPYDSSKGVIITTTNTKALISSLASEDLATSMPKELVNNYRLAMKLQTTIDLNTSHFILFQGKEYEVLFVSKKILQNENLIYEVLVG